MDRRGWVGWVEGNPLVAGGLALCLVMTTASLGVLAARVDDNANQQLAAGDTATTLAGGPDASLVPGETSTTLVAGGGVTGPGGGTARTSNTVGPPKPTANVIPGTKVLPPCAPDRDYAPTGLNSTSVHIGQIVSDVNILPAQFKPMKEGLEAYVKLINAAGGVCGRKIIIDYENDQANPTTHNFEAMTHQDFAFVSNGSLMDSLDYDGNTFQPKYKDNGEYLPDIGGLALSYGRSQSPWYAGVIGSISPVLVGGGQNRFYLDRARAEGHPCATAGVVYLNEPTGASSDQGNLGKVALEAPWGGNLGAGHARLYERNLADPVPAYQLMVRQMVADGVRCVFTYADLGSNINLVQAMNTEGVWPPHAGCPTCFSIVYVPFAAYDPSFIAKGGAGAQQVNTFLPHIPLNETALPAMQTYLNALKQVPNSGPSTFSLMAFTSGQLFVDAIGSCGSKPTRTCVMEQLRATKEFTAGGLLGPDTPFRSTRARCNGDCGSFAGKITWDWKWIAPCTISVRVQGNDWKRDNPADGYSCDTLQVARGTPA